MRRSQSSVARLASIRVTSLIILVLSIAYYFTVCFPSTPKHLDITPYLMFPILLFIASPIIFGILNSFLGFIPPSRLVK
ncbi:MAG TPA: hypothetical protein VNL17_06645 [Verrucomicrobiae bacterium]|nr:hypothetical protein [Verrucomicrobiae bacterium]